ncbi:MAG TPA: hypothetical protein PKH19_04110 [Candidatus Syntrophosphaera sp.]|nr:hypothetical protein [Candidatus Syntrophosphaera sp.]
MQHRFFLTTAFLLCLVALSAQTANRNTNGPGKVTITRAAQDLVIEIKSLLPNESVEQLKTDTYIRAGRYPFSISRSSLREESRKQLDFWQQKLNIWLEESK